MSTIETIGCSKPLAVLVTDAGHEVLSLRALLRQAVPILRLPEAADPACRDDLAARIERAIGADFQEHSCDDIPPFPDREAPTEPEHSSDCDREEGVPWAE